MKKKYIVILLIIMFGLGIGVDKLLLANNDVDDGVSEPSRVEHKNMLSMMLEQNAGEGDYSLETRSSWPTKEDGYVFNSSLSKCEKGSKLRWDDENNAVVMVGTTSDKCYVYFDLIPPVLLADWVKEQYTGTQGENNLYYHNGTVLDGGGNIMDANDGSYRYGGASETTNNFVCFGSDAETCPDDNLYRIIGVFGNQVKLIKWDYANSDLLGTDGEYISWESFQPGSMYLGSKTTLDIYFWNNGNYYTDGMVSYYNSWSKGELNTINLNTNFLNNIGTTWAGKIVTTTWKVGGNTWTNIGATTAATAYTNEIVSPEENTTENTKIGLMYTSDYGFAASPSAWSSNLETYASSSITSVNWIYMGGYDWTITRLTSGDYDGNECAFNVLENGKLSYHDTRHNDNYKPMGMSVRPVFYLNSDVTYVSGSGTKEDCIRIN